MALHEVATKSVAGFDDVYASPLSERALPKYRMPEDESDPRAVYALLTSELALDGNSSQNLATFCTTWSDDEVHRLMDDCLDENMIDKDEYPQTSAWNASPPSTPPATSTVCRRWVSAGPRAPPRRPGRPGRRR